MKLKYRVSMVTTLLLLFTLVLFYQNCSQESGDLFSENTICTGADCPGTESAVEFRFFRIDPATNQPVEVDIIRDRPTLDDRLIARIEGGSSVTSIVSCVHVNGDAVNGCTQNNVSSGGVTYPQSGIPTRILTTGVADCRSMFDQSEAHKPIWQNMKCPYQLNTSGWIEITAGRIFQKADMLRNLDNPTAQLPCNYPLSFTLYTKPNDGNRTNFTTAQVNFIKPARCI